MSDEEPQDTLETDAHVPLFSEETLPLSTPRGKLDERRYQLIEPLGKGGMGEVYRSIDPALERDLAIKVVKADLHGLAEAESRFVREARVTASLQHPSIVPVHNMGRLLDGRLHYTMRLVRGRTFADILRDEGGKPERWPALLGIFEKICQAVAYAHSKRVIHRDLKPANVMVGSFGEVQVMDWGLAKVLGSDEEAEPRPSPRETGTKRDAEAVDTSVQLTRTGSGMGTPAYMPAEQARGEWDAVDERADVFALGSILCQILTGAPAYSGSDGGEVLERARRGNVVEAWLRLGECGADEALTTLCRDCLAMEREGRPRNAAVVAERVTAYQAAVQERLRQAELERVAAEARTQEAYARVAAERRARQRLLALAAAALVFLACGVAVAWWMQQVRQAALARRLRADQQTLEILEQARQQLDEGWRLNDADKLKGVKAEAERAADIAHSGGTSAEVEQRVADFQTEVQQRFGRVEKNDDLLSALLDIATPRETQTERSTDEQYAAAFRRWGLDVDRQTEADAAARLQQEPETVVQGAIAGLDAWMMERRRRQRPEAAWRHLLGVVERLDASEPRRQLRALLIGEAPYRAESVVRGVGLLMGGQSLWLALSDLELNAWRRLRQLRGRLNAAEEPVLTVLLLAQVSMSWGDMAGAEEMLRQALARRPDEASDHLSDNERAAWQALWRDVDELLKRLAK
ncbi:MAG: serine/threonine-protein kinase [Gemmataceae bacterium]